MPEAGFGIPSWDELAGTVTDYAGHAQAWREYELRHRDLPMNAPTFRGWTLARPTLIAGPRLR